MNYKSISLENLDFLLKQNKNKKIGPISINNSTEECFYFEMMVSDEFFDIEVCINGYMVLAFPSGIYYRFILTGTETVRNRKIFIFKPTCLSEENIEIQEQLNDFNLLLPDYIFFAIINECVSKRYFKYSDILNIDGISNLSEEMFLYHGITIMDTPNKYVTSRLIIERVLLPEYTTIFDRFFGGKSKTTKSDIIKFCNANDYPINVNLNEYYFSIENNIWYKANKKNTSFEIGYVRLFFKRETFPNSIFIEVIVAKEHRGISVGDEMINLMKYILKEHSHVLKFIAILPKDLDFFQKTLYVNGFLWSDTDQNTKNKIFECDLMEEIDIELSHDLGNFNNL